MDECLRSCTCAGGNLIDCCRLRSDYGSLSEEERQRYISTVIRAATDPEFKPRYEALVERYKSSFDTLAQNTDPEVSQFFPWNRLFLLEYEDLLQEIDCRVTVPYWDWTALPMNPYMSPFWSPESGFGDSSRLNDSCVVNGPFAYDRFQVTSSASGGCVERQYRLQTFPTRAMIEQDLLTSRATEADYAFFHHFLQIFVHTNVRCFVGGQMCSPDAANDPAFLPHLAQVDSILDRWQGIDEEHLRIAFGNDRRPLVLTDGTLVAADFHDNSNLPNGVSVCYGEPNLKSHVPPSMLFLTQALEEITDNRNLHMSCVGDQDMQSVPMGLEAADFMHKMCGDEHS